MSIFNVNSASFNELTVTGSVNLSGSFSINNKEIENILSQQSKYGRLQWHEVSPNDYTTGTNNAWNTFLGIYQFGFNSGSDWNNSKTSRINMSWWNWPTQKSTRSIYPDNVTVFESLSNVFGEYTNNKYHVHGHNPAYLDKINEIMQNNLKDSYIIKFYHTDDYETRKHFIIKDIKLYEPYFSQSNASSHTNIPNSAYHYKDFYLTSSFGYWGMGSTFFESNGYRKNYNTISYITDMDLTVKKYNLFDSNIETNTRVPGSFNNITQRWETLEQADILSNITLGPFQVPRSIKNPSLGYNDYINNTSTIRTDINFQHFELQVEEIFSSTGSISFDYGDLFWVDFEVLPKVEKRKIIEIVTGSKDIDIPDWAEKITVYAVGAGGGGGGGASGYRSDYVPYLYESYEEFEEEVATIDFNDEWQPISNLEGNPGSVGHEFVTGGGGGAGGCVAIEIIEGQDAINAAGGKLSLTIGKGGSGGSGSSYFDDIVAVDNKFSFPVEYERWKLLNILYPLSPTDRGHPRLFEWGTSVISPFNAEHHGKPGTDTFVFVLNNDGSSKKVVQAQGGNGGTAGFSMKKPYELFHYFCQVYEHFPALIKVPGGANDGTTNIGSEIRIGGPGGYGVSMPIATKEYSQEIYIQSNKTIIQRLLDTFTRNMYGYPKINGTNIAPTIPFNRMDVLTSNRSFDASVFGSWSPTSGVQDYIQGYGNTTRVTNNMDDLIEKYISNGRLIPEKAAPAGGGGGVGVSYQGIMQLEKSLWIDDVYAVPDHKDIFGQNLSKEDFPEYLKAMSNWVTGSIKYGFGGNVNFNEYLLDDKDEKNVTYKFPSVPWKDVKSGNGGYGFYGTNKDITLRDDDNNPVYNVNPTDLSQYYPQSAGYGGGGGAGTFVLSYADRYTNETGNQYKNSLTPELYIADHGQNGANGQDGLAIVIIEQL